jgi:RNA recognition motif-containing protein
VLVVSSHLPGTFSSVHEREVRAERPAVPFLKRETFRMTTLYVGNLPFNATEADVKALFERHGKVDSVKLINDRETGKPRGFGFVDMAQNDAQAAIQALNGFQMNGRPLRVNEAQERPARPRQGGGPFRR